MLPRNGKHRVWIASISRRLDWLFIGFGSRWFILFESLQSYFLRFVTARTFRIPSCPLCCSLKLRDAVCTLIISLLTWMAYRLNDRIYDQPMWCFPAWIFNCLVPMLPVRSPARCQSAYPCSHIRLARLNQQCTPLGELNVMSTPRFWSAMGTLQTNQQHCTSQSWDWGV